MNSSFPTVFGVAAILVNPRKQVLLQQRDDKSGLPYAGYWTLPGGRVEDDEDPLRAIQRELLEEIEIEVPLKFWKVYDRHHPRQGVTVVQYLYTGCIDYEIADIALNEGQALGYFDEQQIDELPIAFDFDVLLKEYLRCQEILR
jgi:8-oxo-dGTP diphosphatase